VICRKCGTSFPDEFDHCPKCGKANVMEHSSETDSNIHIKVFPMKWYLFLLFVYMPLCAFMNLFSGISSIIKAKGGMFEISATEGYSIDTLAKLNLLIGIVSVLMALFAGYTWYNLFKRKKNSLLCINSIYIANMITNVVFLSLLSFIDNNAMGDIVSTVFTMFILPTLIMVGANTVYFRKRSAFFVN